MESIEISREEARRFLISYHGLDGADLFKGEKGILDYIERVGCIQYDPLDVVGHNPDLVLQSRIRGYKPSMLDKLLYKERSLIDGWDKMMAIYLTPDWPYFKRIRKEKVTELAWVLERRGTLEAIKLTGEIRKNLKERGPLLSTQIKLGGGGVGRWGHKNLSGVAMDYMFNIGELGVYSKRNTQKIYDLAESLLPGELLNSPDPFSNDHDFCKWYVERRVGSVGMLWNRNGGGWLGHYLSDKNLRTTVLCELSEEKRIVPVVVKGINELFYVRSSDLPQLSDVSNENLEKEARILAPLDNLLWDRDMVKRIFNFEYTWEVYVPEAKRKYGYYVLPVLYGDNLVARFEPELQRGTDPIRIKKWWWEDDVSVTNEMKNAIRKELKVFAKYRKSSGVDSESLKLLMNKNY